MALVLYKKPEDKPTIANSEILISHFTSLVFLVCIKKKYADSFIKHGTIRFAKPSEWIPDGTSRGDHLEGVYASRYVDDVAMREPLRRLRKQSAEMRIGDLYYYKSGFICGMRAYCMYSLYDTSLRTNTKRSQDHQFHKVGKVSKEYFKNLFPQWDEQKYNETDDDDKPMVLILHPDRFIKKMITALKGIGIKQDEILFQPIQYFDYKADPFVINPPMFELFYKDRAYCNQHEVRVVINTQRKAIQEYFNKNNGLVNLGAIDDTIATISEFYFDDMQVEVRGNKLLYSLAKPITTNDSPEVVLAYLFQALSDELPDSPLSIEEIENRIKKLDGRLKHYGIKYDKDTHVVHYNGATYDIASKAGYKIIEHYVNYINDNDLDGAKDSIMKFKHFYPMYNMDYCFERYFKAINQINSASSEFNNSSSEDNDD